MNQLEFIFDRLMPPSWRKPVSKKLYKPLFFPTSSFVPASKTKFDFTYEIKRQKTVSYTMAESSIHFYGPVNKRKKLKDGMRKFFIDQARANIMPLIEQKAMQTGLQYKTVRFKNQKSLWGSCSDLKNINFNIRLLFLPDDLLEYVIIHELCHLEHMNHSKSFWKLVGSHCKDFHKKELELNQANKFIPNWVFGL